MSPQFRILCFTALCLVLIPVVPCYSTRLCDVIKKFVKPMQTLSIPPPEQRHEGKEHGNFDFLGRQLFKNAIKRVTFVRHGIGNITKTVFKTKTGLDVDRTYLGGGISEFKSRIKAIFPGTRWCGNGNISKSYVDLGLFSKTDKCCREHDLCDDFIPVDVEKYGLINTGLFRRSHCKCDEKFYSCLKEAKTVIANSIGYTYFTVLGPQCFKRDYPAKGCERLECSERGKCFKVSFYKCDKPIYQWFDNPSY